MNLNDALRQIAEHGGLNAGELIAYAAEDVISGNGDGLYSSISITASEGRLLYALTRALKPQFCVEVGHHSGCSATHILAALEANQSGKLHSIDVYEPVPPGIPEQYRPRWSLERLDARYYDWPEVDLVFEDGDHTRDLTANVLRNAIAHGAKCVVSHDAHNATVGQWVCAGFADVVGENYHTVMIDDVALGFAYWFREDVL